MRAGAGFRVALETKRLAVGALHTLQSAIKQGAVSWPQIIRQRVFVYREAVVLAGNHDLASR